MSSSKGGFLGFDEFVELLSKGLDEFFDKLLSLFASFGLNSLSKMRIPNSGLSTMLLGFLEDLFAFQLELLKRAISCVLFRTKELFLLGRLFQKRNLACFLILPERVHIFVQESSKLFISDVLRLLTSDLGLEKLEFAFLFCT